MENSSEIVFVNPNEIHFKGHRFFSDLGWAGKRRATDAEGFTLVKNKTYLDSYAELLKSAPKSVFEVGFFEGGSSVFFDLLFTPDQLTCVDRRVEEIATVSAYIAENDRHDNFRLIYGFDQGNVYGLRDLVQQHHGGSLDLVIDDASHQYELSRATFSALFPRLKPGGIYVLEDYGWAHDKRYQEPDHIWAKNPSLCNLVFELTMVAAGNAAIISKIEINRGMCIITKGQSAGPDPFIPNEHYCARGRKLELL